MLAIRIGAEDLATLTFEPARQGVLSWNTFAERGEIAFRLLAAGYPESPWLPYAKWSPEGRQSFSPEHQGVRVEVDVVASGAVFDGIEVRAPGTHFNAIAFATPAHAVASLPYAGEARILDVPVRSQYVADGERGWCSPASLAMLNAYHGFDYDVTQTALAVFDRAYNGTGNWAFNVAFSGSLGLRAAVAYLRNLDHAQRLVEAGIPLAISYGWSAGELPGAPIDHSSGHLAVLCGFTANGDCVVNDPAAPNIRRVYGRNALESLWQRNQCVAYLVAPVGLDFTAIVNS